MNVLVIAPHPDDEAIGCGGMICRHVSEGGRVTAVFLTSGELGLKKLPREKAWKIREAEARRAGKILGLSELHFLRQPDWMVGEQIAAAAAALRPILQEEKPALIYLPHPLEWHPDHKAVLKIVRRVLRGSKPPPPKLRGYEVWTPLGEFDEIQDISAAMPRKLRALRAHHSQLKEFNYVRAVHALNAFRGELAARCRYAEVFQTIELKPER